MQLEFDSTILDTHCNCIAGKGFCKHATAICIFVNAEIHVQKWINLGYGIDLHKYSLINTLKDIELNHYFLAKEIGRTEYSDLRI